jgi:hypothetical protein
MTTDIFDPVHAAEVAAAAQDTVRQPDRKALETSPLYGFPLGHWNPSRRPEEV